MLKLAIIYRLPDGRPLSVAMINNNNLLHNVADIAMADAQKKAEELCESDPVLGRIEMEEAGRLRRTLGFLLREQTAPATENSGAVQ
jgi:hypothetical protein